MKLSWIRLIQFCLVLLLGATSHLGAQVKVWEEDLAIPTWLIGPPEVDPTFSWSSSRQEVYPYPYKETLTDERVDKTYRACWLENEFIKVLVLPEIGGRLHGAVDKTNNYNFFYWHPTIKPALVGMTGSWISGGIEWNFPHGHRPTGFSPVQHRLVENPDGSKTIWVGEPELVQRMRWVIGLTIYPGKSVIEAKVRLMNPTPLRHSFQMWATTAMNTNDQFQANFPTRLMTGHGKHEYWHWPIDNGVDISWWKNVPNAASYFAVETGEFFGAWDHGKNAGTIITGDPNIVVGKKFWTWGTSPSGRIWETILADGEGAYLEPQAGGYSDNQPDYHWIEPGEVKSYSHFFFPVRDIGYFKIANVDGALNLELKGDQAKVGVYSTSILKSARILLTERGRQVLNRVVDLDPGKPFVEEIPLGSPAGPEEDYRLSVTASDGREVIAYAPKKLPPVELPEALPPLADPEKMASGDELWHAGDWLYKFRDPEQGEKYFQEAIRRDPGDSRSRTSLAELDILRMDYSSALNHLSFAEKRDPDNGRLFYLKGMALDGAKQVDGAYKAFYRAVHFEDYLARAYERLATINMRRGNAVEAARQADLALDKNALNPQLWALLATAQRVAGDPSAALDSAEECLKIDPLSAWGANEKAKALAATGRSDQEARSMVRQLLHDTQTSIEFAVNYANAGRYQEALELLDGTEENALVLYYRGFFADRAGEKDKATALFGQARTASVDYSFAFRPEAIDVFETALQYAPGDGKARYFEGLVYAKVARVDRAINAWKESTRLDPRNPRAWRDLGLALARGGDDLKQAEECYYRALELDPKDSRVLLELDQVRQDLGVSDSERLAFLQDHLETVKTRDALIGELSGLLVNSGQFAEALSYLQTNHFNSWEGGYGIHNIYMEANIGMARQATTPEKALEYYKQACEYPANLEVAPREPNLRGFLYYPMALRYKETGNESEARKLLQIAAGEASEYPTLGTYYRAMALRELGQADQAREVLGQLESEAKLLIQGESKNYLRTGRNRQEAMGHLFLSKVYEAAGRVGEAEKELAAAVELVRDIERQALTNAQITFARAHQ